MLLVLLAGYSRRDKDKEGKLRRQAREIRSLGQAASRVQSKQELLSRFLQDLPRLVEKLNSPTEWRQIPTSLLNVLVRNFNPERAAVLIRREPSLTEPQDETQLVVAQVSSPGSDFRPGMVFSLGKRDLGYLAQWKGIIDRREPEHKRLGLQGFKSTVLAELRVDLAVPMVTGERVWGMLAFTRPQEKWEAHNQELLDCVSRLGALALKHAAEITQARSRAELDPLTGVFNKAALEYRLGELLFRLEAGHGRLAILLFDIDHFKNYNDANGHLAGDQLLRAVVKLVGDQVRSSDIFCRFGGDEFVLIFPGMSSAQAGIVGEKIRDAVEEYDFPFGDKQPLGSLTISGGIASYPADADNLTALLKAADNGLYRSKACGRNRIMPAASDADSDGSSIV